MQISQTLLNLQENKFDIATHNAIFLVKTSSLITFRLPVLLGTSTITMHMNSSVYFDYQRFSIRFCRKRESDIQHVTAHVYGMKKSPKDETCTFSLLHQFHVNWLTLLQRCMVLLTVTLKTISTLCSFCRLRMWQIQQTLKQKRFEITH